MKFIYLVVFIFTLSLVSSAVGYDNPSLYGIRPEVVTTTTTGNGSVNASAINHFDLAPLSLFWSVAGHIMDILLDMEGFDIRNVRLLDAQNVNVTENITLGGFFKDDETNSVGFVAQNYWDENGTWTIAG